MQDARHRKLTVITTG